MSIVKIAGAILLGASGVASIALVGWLFNEVKRLKKEVSRLRKLFTQVCKNWSADAEDVAAEILEMVADHELEVTELKQKLKNERHARNQLAKGGKKQW